MSLTPIPSPNSGAAACTYLIDTGIYSTSPHAAKRHNIAALNERQIILSRTRSRQLWQSKVSWLPAV